MQDIAHALTTIEQKNFLSQTYIASSHSLVKNILARTPEVTLLLQQRQKSLPLMHSRYRLPSPPLPEHARLVYFLLFDLAHDQDMVPDILTYLKQSLTSTSDDWQFPWHPFLYGAAALMNILDDPSPLDIYTIAEHPEAFIARMERLSRGNR